MLSTADEVRAAVSDDPRLSAWRVLRHTEDYLELGRDGSILVLTWPALWRNERRMVPHLTRSRSGNYSLLLFGRDEEFSDGVIDRILQEAGDARPVPLPVSTPISTTRLVVTLRAREDTSKLVLASASLEFDLEAARYENDMLISVGRALGQQRDLDSLLELILSRTREVTGADAGSIYVVEGDHDDARQRTLRFKVSQNDSISMESHGFAIPVSESSIVGTCVLSRDVINIPDLYALDAPGEGNNPWGFVHDRSFDDKHQYQTRSMLTVPMISARSQVIGVIQLINKRARGFLQLSEPWHFDDGAIPFDELSVNYAATLASQAGIGLENAMLYDEVKTLFEGFVRASVTAIESRDPTTSGHSERVAGLTVGLAQVVDGLTEGPFAGHRFAIDDLKQIEYAALLHDFGKVGVREHVLVKAKKLYEHQRDLILARFHFIRKSLEAEGLRSRVERALAQSREQLAATLLTPDDDTVRSIAELDEFVSFILTANEPSILDQGGFERIADIAARTYLSPDGATRNYLDPDEASALQILRGSLTSEERGEIESHVVHTFNFLKQIPWGRAYRDIPHIAGTHHEKLDGSGYPHGLAGDAIPLPARMMTISDIYDALTASDRPYKKAMPVSRALDILSGDVKRGALDGELFTLFVEAKIFERTKSQ